MKPNYNLFSIHDLGYKYRAARNTTFDWLTTKKYNFNATSAEKKRVSQTFRAGAPLSEIVSFFRRVRSRQMAFKAPTVAVKVKQAI